MQTTTPTVVRDIVDAADERELWILGREFERPPWFIAGKGGDTRLARALRVCIEGRVTPHSDGSYTVEGSEGRTYRVTDSCSCPQSQRGKSKFCYHHCAVALYVEWQKRLRPAAPVALGTLRTGTLPLPPTTVDERLAQAAAVALDAVHVALGTMHDSTALQTHHTPQEDRMDDNEYIPEPDTDDAPVATLEPPATPPALRPRTPQVDDLEAALQVWTTERAVVQRFLKQELKANIDYYTLRIGGKESKPSLSKAGAEKVLGWLKLQASFTPDTGTWEMLGRPQDLICYVCTIRTRSGEVVGEGRGARSLKKDGGDVNKAIKMAEKSACVSAVLRTGALSDVFTCDLEDMQEEPAKSAPVKPNPLHPSAELRQRIWAKVQELAPEARTREAVEAFISEHTGHALHPDFYREIIMALEARA